MNPQPQERRLSHGALRTQVRLRWAVHRPKLARTSASVLTFFLLHAPTLTQIADITPLANCLHLGYLDLSTTLVTDISVLSSFGELVTLMISNNGATDLSPLAGIGSLREVNVTNTRVLASSHLLLQNHTNVIDGAYH